MMLEERQFWTLGAGRVGVGKSFLTASMGVVLARMGRSIILVDADFGSPNLHTFFGIKSPGCTVLHIIENRASEDDGLMSTAQPGLKLIACKADGPADFNPTVQQKEEVIK